MTKKFNVFIRQSTFKNDIESKLIFVYSRKHKERIVITCQRHTKEDGTLTEWYSFTSRCDYDLLYNSFKDLKQMKAIKEFATALNKVYKYDVDVLTTMQIAFEAKLEKCYEDYDNYMKHIDTHKYASKS